MKPATPQRKIALFLALGALLALPSYVRIISAGTLGVDGGLWVLALMWAPGIAGIVTRLVTQGDLRGMGWGIGKPRFLAYAYFLPVVLGLVVYPMVWVSGLGGLDVRRLQTAVAGIGFADASVPMAILIVATVGVLRSLISATGEEIGWRGLLVPELAKITGPTQTALVSGAIWAIYHFPLILLANYRSGTPKGYALVMFTIMVMGISFVLTWMRQSSGSVWSAVLFHGAHNLFIQGVFDRTTVELEMTEYVTTEFGVGLAVAYGLVAWLVWKRRFPRLASRPGPAPQQAEALV